MADYAYPTVAYNNRVVSPREYEDLASPQATDGLIGSPSQASLVYADSSLLGVKIRANQSALLRGLRWEAGSTERSVPLDPNTTSGTIRKDLIVLRMTRNPWNATPAVIKGAPSAQPITPSPTYGENTATGLWELPLAEVTIPYNDAVTDAAQCKPLAWYVGSDGQIRCTSTTRPPHETGRWITETDTGRVLISDGSKWLIGVDDSGQVALSLGSGWAASVNVVQRRNGLVFLALSPQRTGGNIAAGVNVTLGTLPTGFRPPVVFEGVITKTGGGGRVTVNPNGVVALFFYDGIASGNFANVQALTFPAA